MQQDFDSIHNFSLQEARIVDVAKGLVLRGIVQGAIQSIYRRYFCVTKLMQRFREALLLVKKIIREAAISLSASA